LSYTGLPPANRESQRSPHMSFIRKQFSRPKVYRLLPGLRDWGIVPSGLRDWGVIAPGFNVTSQTPPEVLLKLIRKLRPQNCGIDLVRIGGPGDGGYLVPDDLNEIEYCFSPGVNTISDFENQLADRGIKSFLADYSVDAPPILRPEFTFDKKFLGSTNNDEFMTLAFWKDKYLSHYAEDLILQMDIEGSEYEVIFNVPDDLFDQFRIIVIEFHSLQLLFEPIMFRLLSTCFEKLLKSFSVVHIHPNNCGDIVKRGNIEVPMSMEFTFLNKKRVRTQTPVHTFPNKLDRPNSPTGRNMTLPSCWYMDM
jgi:hypothetical protein